MTRPRGCRIVVVLGVLSVLAAACSADDRPVLVEGADGGVQTADAASASDRPTAAAAVDGLQSDDLSPDEQPGPADTPGGQGTATTSSSRSLTTSPETLPKTLPPTSLPYPEITEEITPVQGDIRAMLTPTGVLVGVVGETSAGYVVETPCGGVTQLVWGQPVTDIQVVLDPGHGGDEAGAADSGPLTEAELNLRVARRTAAELVNRSISVVLTRNGDYRIPIRRRAALADLIAPRAFISIHHNTPASRPSPQPGTEVFVQNASSESKRLGGLLYEEVFSALDEFDVEWTSRDDAGVLSVLNDEGEDAYGIARYPTSTSALVEMAYLGNEKEAVLLATDDYLIAAADALADGIERFLTTSEPGSGFVETPRQFNPSGATGGSGGCIDPPLE